jgi:hypothetical protein
MHPLTITGVGLEHLKGISRLDMLFCRDEAIAAAESLGLPVARRAYTHYGAFETSFVKKGGGGRLSLMLLRRAMCKHFVPSNIFAHLLFLVGG